MPKYLVARGLKPESAGWHKGKKERSTSESMSLFLSNLKCYPWLETDANAAASLVGLYAQLTDTLHHKFRGGSSAGLCSRTSERLVLFVACAVEAIYDVYVADRLLPGQRGALWLCMMQYCESCTSPRTPEYLLYLYHTHLRSLPWRHLHPDTKLMEQLFNASHSTPSQLVTPDPSNAAHWSRRTWHSGAC